MASINNLASVTLLAGFSTRMGMPKQHVTIFGKSFLEHVIAALKQNEASFCKKVFVGQEKDEKAQQLVKSIGGFWVNNPTPELGPLSSVRLAIENLSGEYSILLWPIDHPLIKAQTVSSVINAWKKSPDRITLPSNGIRRGHPTIFPNWACKEMFNIELSKGAKQVLLNHPEDITYVITDDPFITTNLNTPEAVKQLTMKNEQ